MTRVRQAIASAAWLLAACAGADGLLRNGSFEKADAKGMPSGWQGEIRAGVEGRFELSPEARAGRLALRIVHANAAKEWIRASQEPIPVRGGMRCRFKAWVKATGPWQVQYYEFVPGGTYTSKTLASGRATDWQHLSRTVTLGQDTERLKLSLIAPAQGDVWFDAVDLADLDQPPRLRIPQLAAVPTLDGDVSEDAWQGAALVDGFLVLGGQGETPAQDTRVRLGVAAGQLWVAWECAEARLAEVRLGDTPSWADDTVELFLCEPGQQAVHHLGVTPGGGRLAQVHEPEPGVALYQDWFSTKVTAERPPVPELPPYVCAARQAAARWTAEMALDLRGRGVAPAGRLWRLQLARSRKVADIEENSTWALTPGDRFNVPDRFAVVALAAAADAGTRELVSAPPFVPPRTARIVPLPRQVHWLEGQPAALAGPVRIAASGEAVAPAVTLLTRLLAEYFSVSGAPGLAAPQIVVRCEPLALPAGLAEWQRAEAYALEVRDSGVTLRAEGTRGALFGVQTLRQMATVQAETLYVPQAQILDWPELRWRGWHLIGPETSAAVPAARRVVDLLAALKLNWIALQIDNRLRYERDPRLSRGPDAPTKAELRALVTHAQSLGLEVIPMTQCWSHFSYFLAKDAFRHLAEVPDPPEKAQHRFWNYCPRHPETHALLFGMIEEQLECFPGATIFHAGLDEITFEPIGQCERCRGTSGGVLLAEEIGRIHGFLKGRGLRLAMWGDQLLVEHNGKHFQTAEALPDIPRDVLVFDWHYNAGAAFPSLAFFKDQGFEVMASGWYEPLNVSGFSAEAHRQGILGYGGTTWYAIDRIRREVRLLAGIALTAEATWSRQALDLAALPYRPVEVSQDLWERTPDATGFVPIELTGFANRRLADAPEWPGWMGLGPKHDLSALPSGRQWLQGVPFDLLPNTGPQCLMLAAAKDTEGNLPADAWQVPLGIQAEALVFLHTGSRPERFARHIYDRAKVNPGPIGAYVIHYADGETEELRLEWNVTLSDWNSQLGSAFGRTAWSGTTAGGALARIEALTWRNPHPEKTITAFDVVSSRSTVRPVLLAVTAVVSEP
jgi:hypothetical protein